MADIAVTRDREVPSRRFQSGCARIGEARTNSMAVVASCRIDRAVLHRPYAEVGKARCAVAGGALGIGQRNVVDTGAGVALDGQGRVVGKAGCSSTMAACAWSCHHAGVVHIPGSEVGET